jgi:hypothetical protein
VPLEDPLRWNRAQVGELLSRAQSAKALAQLLQDG